MTGIDLGGAQWKVTNAKQHSTAEEFLPRIVEWESCAVRGRGVTASAFCLSLVAAGKAKKLALTVAMAKLMVILNALVRDGQPWRAPQSA